jgi:hypothetical protein
VVQGNQLPLPKTKSVQDNSDGVQAVSIHHATIYNKFTGKIVQTGSFSCDADFVDINFAVKVNYYGGSDHDFIDAPADDSIHYVITVDGIPAIVPRPILRVSPNKTQVVANGTDSITLRGLPDPCEVIQDSGEPEESRVTVEGGGFVFTAETPGIYRFRIERFPFMPLDLEFTAT